VGDYGWLRLHDRHHKKPDFCKRSHCECTAVSLLTYYITMRYGVMSADGGPPADFRADNH
jgi:hypothetical protein